MLVCESIEDGESDDRRRGEIDDDEVEMCEEERSDVFDDDGASPAILLYAAVLP